MEKTKVNAEEGKQEITITREFELPVHLLFRAYTEAALVEQWMGNKVLEMESKVHGSYRFETRGKDGTVLFQANGIIHEFQPDRKITRTFEMENTPFSVQLEFLQFEPTAPETSKLTIHTIFRSVEERDNLLKMPFAAGLNMAHNRLQQIIF
ncbi:Activator of Hsp90 ATPase -like protein [compost metagenome]